MKKKLSQLKKHPINSNIYDDTDDQDLKDSIKTNGLLNPLIITKDGTILSGHRRFESLKSLGIKECEVIISTSNNSVVELIEHNRYRTKTNGDILREARILEKELKDVIGRGRSSKKNRVEDKDKKLNTANEVAKKLGVGLTRLKQLLSIEKYQPTLLKQIDDGSLSVNGAYKIIKEKHLGNVSINKDKFITDYKKLIKKYDMGLDDIEDFAKKTYPYSLPFTKIEEDDRQTLINELDELKKYDAVEFNIIRKKEELEQSQITSIQIDNAKKLLPTLKELEYFFKNCLNEIEIISSVDKNFDSKLYSVLRTCITNMENAPTLGRGISSLVGFRNTKKDFKLLGIIRLTSPSHTIGVRDNFIDWDDENKIKYRESIVNLQVCAPSQPFGFNYLGGKFLSLIGSQLILDRWEKKYNTKIVGIETTALYGNQSMYDGMKSLGFRNLGTTTGSMLIKPSKDTINSWNVYLARHFKEDFDELGKKTSPLQSKLRFLLQVLGISSTQYETQYKRGYYFYSLYENTTEYLNGKIKENKLIPFVEDGKKLEWWKKQSGKRYRKLKKEKRLQTDILFFDKIDENDLMNWLRTRNKSKITDFSDFKF